MIGLAVVLLGLIVQPVRPSNQTTYVLERYGTTELTRKNFHGVYDNSVIDLMGNLLGSCSRPTVPWAC